MDFASLKPRYSYSDGSHRIDISNSSGAVGYIEWDEDGGEVSKIFVGDKLRRQGIGTYLWELATEWAEQNQADPPEHSDRRSRDGDEFAKAIGGHIPPLRDDVDGWSTRQESRTRLTTLLLEGAPPDRTNRGAL